MNVRGLAMILGSIATVAALAWLTAKAIDARDDGATVAGQIRRLKTGSLVVKRDAATTLAHVLGPGAQPATIALTESLQDPDVELRARCCRSIGMIARLNPTLPTLDGAALALTDRLKDPAPRVRASAAIGLRRIHREAVGQFEALLDGIRSDDPSLRIEAETELGGFDRRTIDWVDWLLGLLDDPSRAVRTFAKTTLVRPSPFLRPDLFLPLLAARLRSESPEVRQVVAVMLGRSVERTPAARDLLTAVLKDVNPAVRLAATAAIGAYAEERPARDALRIATVDPDLRVRATAWASLAVGRRANRTETIGELRRALDGDRTRADLADLVETGSEAAIPRLIAALRDPNARLRAAAARSLGEFASIADARVAINALISCLSDPEPTVRRDAAASLARFGPDAAEAAAALRRASVDADRSVSGQAYLSLIAVEGSRRTR